MVVAAAVAAVEAVQKIACVVVVAEYDCGIKIAGMMLVTSEGLSARMLLPAVAVVVAAAVCGVAHLFDMSRQDLLQTGHSSCCLCCCLLMAFKCL